MPTLLLAGIWWVGPAPAATAQYAPSPYHTQFAVEVAITLGLAGLSTTGLLVWHKRVATEAEVAAMDRQQVLAVVWFSTGWYSDRSQTTSDALR